MTAGRILPLHAPTWEDYVLLDSGSGRKLERFGPYTLARPEPAATWQPRLPAVAWEAADAIFTPTRKSGDGVWERRQKLPPRWELRYRALRFWAQLSASRHLGVFPENATHWDWLGDRIRAALRAPARRDPAPQPFRVLNLFGYTGLATLAAAQAGAAVTHVDAAAQAVKLARENQLLAGLAERPIRWIVDDALKFTHREARRGQRYEGLILDPPRFGRGPQGEVWDFVKQFAVLGEACRAVLSEQPDFVIITIYTRQATADDLCAALDTLTAGLGGTLVAGELLTREQSGGRLLPNALYARWANTAP